MLSLESQRNSFNIVISDKSRVKSPLCEIREKLSQLGFNYYLILHDKDKDLQGETKRAHYHLVITSLKRLRVKQVINYMCDIFSTNNENIQIDEVINIVSAVQYLIHMNDCNKYQYEVNEVMTNNEENYQALLLEVPKSQELTTAMLINYILVDKLNRLQLIDSIGIGKYQHYRSTINDIYDYVARKSK